MIVGCAVTVTLGIIVDPVVDDLVFPTWSGKGLTTVEYPGCTETPPWCQTVHRHQVDVVTTVVVGVIPAPSVDTFDFGFRPRQRIAQPSRETAVVFSCKELHTIGLSVARQYQTFDLDLTAEGLAVAIVQYIRNLTVIAFDGEIVGLVRGNEEESCTDLICDLRFDDVATDGIAVEGCRCALVAQSMDVLCRPGIGRLDVECRCE